MIITDSFVFLHLGKTGGTFVEKVLERLLSETGSLYIATMDPVLRQHQTIREIPKPHKHKPILVSVRNPYDYYVSLYEFGAWKAHRKQWFNEKTTRSRYPNYPDLTFPEFVDVVNSWGCGYLKRRPKRPWNPSTFEKARIGNCSYLLLQCVLHDPLEIIERLDDYARDGRAQTMIPNVHFIKQNNLNQDLFDFLLGRGFEPTQLEFIQQMGKVRPANSKVRDESKHWSEQYSPALLAQVRYLDRLMFAMFPEFDQQVPAQPRA
jgi:hypothetical protein